MSAVALFPTGQTPQYHPSVNTADYESNPDALINPDVTAVAGQPLRYWKRVVNAVELMTQGERDAVDAAALAAAIDAFRDAAAEAAEAQAELGLVIRALVIVTVEELNDIRLWLRDFKTATAGAATLAAFKTAVAALPNMPDRTAVQARTALLNHINAGDAD